MKNKNLIPKGLYCYSIDSDGHEVRCFYWGVDKDHDLPQENGYCSYLEKGDYDLNREEIWTTYFVKDGIKKEGTAAELGEKLSLLWDQVKECGINDEIDENELEQ